MRDSLLAKSAAMLAFALVLGGCEGRKRFVNGSETTSSGSYLSGPSVAELDLTSGLAEGRTSSLFGTSSGSFSDFVLSLHKLNHERGASDATRGVFVRLGTARIGLARATEVGELLRNTREHQPVVCHADELNNATALLAAVGCSRVWISPAGGVDTVGIAAQLLYGARLLHRLHVTADFLQVGRYKGAEEPFTRDGPSPEARASLTATLVGLRAAWLSGLVGGRKPAVDHATPEAGPYTPSEAVDNHLVDAVGYVDDARDEAKRLAATDRVVNRFGGRGADSGSGLGLSSLVRSLAGSSSMGTPHIAVLVAQGSISMDGSSSLTGGHDGITERALGRSITKLLGDSTVKAVVLRIDSPGGSALASDLLWKKLMRLRGAKRLVVSIGDMAASGGYYLSCAADRIVAEPTSIVGSIGVVGGKFVIGGALEELGVHSETVPAAPPEPGSASRAAYMSALTPWDDATRKRVLASMTSVYELFLGRVAEGRKLPIETVQTFAEGQIFGGADAKARGLVDETGGLQVALRIARDLAKLPVGTPVEVVDHDTGLLDLLSESESGEASALSPALRDARNLIGAAVHAAPELGAPGIASFADSLAPLLTGTAEHAVCSMPFALTVR